MSFASLKRSLVPSISLIAFPGEITLHLTVGYVIQSTGLFVLKIILSRESPAPDVLSNRLDDHETIPLDLTDAADKLLIAVMDVANLSQDVISSRNDPRLALGQSVSDYLGTAQSSNKGKLTQLEGRQAQGTADYRRGGKSNIMA